MKCNHPRQAFDMSNSSLFGLPQEIYYCKKCVISNQRPNSTVEMRSDGIKKSGIKFVDGICDACRFAEQKAHVIDWDKRNEDLYQLLKKYRKNDGNFDVIVPSSGGKDSSYTAYLLKHKYNMTPLAVTWAPNLWTDIGRQNFENLTKIGGVDSYLCTPNGQLHSYLTRLAFLNLCHPFQPFIFGQKVIGPKIAAQLGIQLVVYGENQAEYGNLIEENASPFMSPDFFVADRISEIKFGGVECSSIIENTDFNYNDFALYTPLKNSQLSDAKIKMTYLGYFERWDPQEIFYFVSKNTGFQTAPERSEGTYSRYTEIDDKIVPFHFYTTFIKFGIGRATYDACQELRNGHIDRDEAVALVQKFDGEFPQKWFDEFLNYIKINEETFFEVIDRNRSPHLWQWVLGEYKLRSQVFNAKDN